MSASAVSQPPAPRDRLIASLREEAALQGCGGIIMASGSVVLAEGTCIVLK